MPADTFNFNLEYNGTGNFAWSTGDANIAAQPVKIQHGFAFAGYPDYSDFRLRITINYYNTSFEWLSVSGAGIVDNLKYPIGLYTNSFLNFQNLDLLQTGNYQADIYYIIEGNVNGYWDQLESRQLLFNLNITAGNQIKTEKDLYTVFFNKSTLAISGETTINIINNSVLLIIDVSQISKIIFFI